MTPKYFWLKQNPTHIAILKQFSKDDKRCEKWWIRIFLFICPTFLRTLNQLLRLENDVNKIIHEFNLFPPFIRPDPFSIFLFKYIFFLSHRVARFYAACWFAGFHLASCWLLPHFYTLSLSIMCTVHNSMANSQSVTYAISVALALECRRWGCKPCYKKRQNVWAVSIATSLLIV